MTPESRLVAAAKEGRTETVKQLLAEGDDESIDKALVEAASCGHTEIVQTFMDCDGVCRVKAIDALEKACQNGCAGAVNALLRGGVDPSETFALPLAVEHNQTDVIDILLSLPRTTWDNFALHATFEYACQQGNYRVVQFIVQSHREKINGFCLCQADLLESVDIALQKDFREVLTTLLSHMAVMSIKLDQATWNKLVRAQLTYIVPDALWG